MVKTIIILGVPHDRAIVSFRRFVGKNSVPVIDGRMMESFNFGINLNPHGNSYIKVNDLEYDLSRDLEVGIFVRNPTLIFPMMKSKLSKFTSREYFSSIWALCALTANVINKPGYRAWYYEQLFKTRLASSFLSEFKTDDPYELIKSWNRFESFELHLENQNILKRSILRKEQAYKLCTFSRNGCYRAIYSPSSKYIIYLFVGKWCKLLLNEVEFDVDSESFEKFLTTISRTILTMGIRLFALVLTVDKNKVFLVKIVLDPPFVWYADFEDDVNKKILDEFNNPSTKPMPIRDLS